jgi:SAM-dependent methyltransferase
MTIDQTTKLSQELRVISPLDTMLDNGEEAYFNIGRLALNLCQKALGGRRPRRVVDFPVGFGRVVRWFRCAWPEAEILGIEIDRHALSFVKEQFGVHPIEADAKLADTKIAGNADLIFSGSLLTHFDEWQWDAFIRLCVPSLGEDGLLVFTTHGRVAALQLKENPHRFGDLVDGRALYAAYRKRGFAYLPYSASYPTFGVSLSSPAWVMSKLQAVPELKIVGFEEQGWGQDVIVCKRNPWPMVVDDAAGTAFP